MQPHRLFKALSDPSRLRILNLLLEEPLCVCELEAILELPQSLLSRHLAYLRGAGLVVDKRQGPRVQYSLCTAQPAFELLKSCLRQALFLEEVYRKDLRRCQEIRAQCCRAGSAGSRETYGIPTEVMDHENQGLDV